jgi:hypothetical protein|tara:strand:+ start:186 stop:374 length:189 start_codon:yes stop_codon:yes gene_type:complete
MNAELLGIIAVVIVLLGVGVAIVAQSDQIQTILQIEGHRSIPPIIAGTNTYNCYPSILPECR